MLFTCDCDHSNPRKWYRAGGITAQVAPVLVLNLGICFEVYFHASSLHFRNAFLAVSFNYASYRKCFHNGNSRASRWHVSCGSCWRSHYVIIFAMLCRDRVCRLRNWVVTVNLNLSDFTFPGHFTIKVSSVLIRYVLICVKRRISWNALMPCRGRKIIIYPAGSFTKYWNHISNFCFRLELPCVDGRMFHFQLLLLFCLWGDFQKCWTEKERWAEAKSVMLLPR